MSFAQELKSRIMPREAVPSFEKRLLSKVRADLSTLSSERERLIYIAELEYYMCKHNLFYFLTNYCKTLNTQMIGVDDAKMISYFPKYRFLYWLCRIFQEYNGIIAIAKSRQLMVSWWACGAFLWDAAFHSGKTILFHSSDAYKVGYGGTEDATVEQCLLGRVEFMYNHLPPFLQSRIPVTFNKGSERPTMTFYHRAPDGGKPILSRIIGIPDANPRALNMFTPTGILNDEISLQRDPETFHQASVPIINRNTKRIDIGTATEMRGCEKSRMFLRSLIYGAEEDTEEPPFEELMPYSDSYQGEPLRKILNNEADHILADRMLVRRRKNRIITILLYFTAHPEKGKRFEKEQREVMQSEARHRQEHWIDFDVVEESRTLWQIQHESSIRVIEYDPNQPPPYDTLYISVDFGAHAAALFWQVCKVEGCIGVQVRCLGEVDVAGRDALTANLARIIWHRKNMWFGNPPIRCFPDVAGMQSNRQTGKTDIQVFTDVIRQEFDPTFSTFQRRIDRKDGINEFADKLSEIIGYDKDGNPIPGFVINPARCPRFLRVLRGALRQAPDGTIMKIKSNYAYEHLADCARYFAANVIRRRELITPNKLEEMMKIKEPQSPQNRREEAILALFNQRKPKQVNSRICE